MRRAIGYVRDENGDFEEKEKAITKFAEENNLIVERIYFEQSGCEIEEISKLNEISEKYENIILLVNDISDIFESNEHIIIAMRLWEKDILVIDTSYPAFRYENIIKEVCNNLFWMQLTILCLSICFRSIQNHIFVRQVAKKAPELSE